MIWLSVVALLLVILLWAQAQSQATERNAKDQALLDLLGQFQVERQAWALERAKLLTANESERDAFKAERTGLLNRIQAPEVSSFQPPRDVIGPPSVSFDDDEDFQKAFREAQMESSS